MSNKKTCYQVEPEIHIKAWGKEIWIHNDEEYCGKILCFEAGKKFSAHFHLSKKETWYVSKGSFEFLYWNTDNASLNVKHIGVGDIIEVPRGAPHQLKALEYSEIFEISTQHFENDSFRILAGDSQHAEGQLKLNI